MKGSERKKEGGREKTRIYIYRYIDIYIDREIERKIDR